MRKKTSQPGGSSVRQLKPRQSARRCRSRKTSRSLRIKVFIFASIVRMLWLIVCLLSLANVSKCERDDPVVFSFSDAVRTGATMVSRFLNSKSFQAFSSFFDELTEEMKVARRGSGGQGNGFILFVLRLMGVDHQKVTNFAFDGLISLVHLMNQILIKDGERRRKEKAKSSLFQFVLSQPRVGRLLTQMQDPKLVDLILKESEEKLKHYPEENVDCIKALICRTKPFVQEMQRSLRFFMNRENNKISGEETCAGKAHEDICRKGEEGASWEKANLEDRMYFFLPSLKEVVECGDECDRIFPNCVY